MRERQVLYDRTFARAAGGSIATVMVQICKFNDDVEAGVNINQWLGSLIFDYISCHIFIKKCICDYIPRCCGSFSLVWSLRRHSPI